MLGDGDRRRAQVAVLLALSAATACAAATESAGPSAQTASKVAFTVQPSNATAGSRGARARLIFVFMHCSITHRARPASMTPRRSSFQIR